jgi:hypothetical protein
MKKIDRSFIVSHLQGENGDPLLKEQEEFERRGERPAASLRRVRTDSKRERNGRNDNENSLSCSSPSAVQSPVERDVVSVGPLPQQPPTSQLQPTSCVVQSHQTVPSRHQNEDAQQRLEREDRHVTSLLGRIMERQVNALTSTPEEVRPPKFRTTSFPHATHRTQRHETVSFNDSPSPRRSALQRDSASLQRPPLPPSSATSLLAEIRSENAQKLSQMTEEEISTLQRELHSALDSNTLQMLKRRGQRHAVATPPSHRLVVTDTRQFPATSSSPTLVERLEREKVRWLQEESPSLSSSSSTTSHTDTERSAKTHVAPFLVQRVRRYRYDFEGQRVKDPDVEEAADIPLTSGLYHHGAMPHKPGYTLPELHHLATSVVPGQRNLALKTLTAIWRRFATPCEAPTLSEALACRQERECVLLEAFNTRLPVTLRHLLDDNTRSVLEQALDALHALLCATHNDTLYTLMHAMWPHIGGVYPLVPWTNYQSHNKTSTATTDFECMQRDLVRGLLRTGLLVRLRYLLEVVSESLSLETRSKIYDILTRVAYHDPHTVQQHLLRCPRLLPVLIRCATQRSPLQFLALRTLRVMCEATAQTGTPQSSSSPNSANDSTRESDSSEEDGESEESDATTQTAAISSETLESEALGNETWHTLITQLVQSLSVAAQSTDTSRSSAHGDNSVFVCLEILRLWRLRVHYGEGGGALFLDYFERFLPYLTGQSTRSLLLSAALFDVLERIVAVSRSTESTSPASSLSWQRLSPLFDLSLQTFESVVKSLTNVVAAATSPSREQLLLVASLLHLLATFIAAHSTQASAVSPLSDIFPGSRPFREVLQQLLLPFFDSPFSTYIIRTFVDLYRRVLGTVRLSVALPNVPTVSWGVLMEPHVIYAYVLLGWMRLLSHTTHYVRTVHQQNDILLRYGIISPQRLLQLQDILRTYLAYCQQPTHWDLVSVDSTVLYAEQPLHFTVYLVTLLLSQYLPAEDRDQKISELLSHSAQYLVAHCLPGAESHLLALFGVPSLALAHSAASSTASCVSPPPAVLSTVSSFFIARLSDSLRSRSKRLYQKGMSLFQPLRHSVLPLPRDWPYLPLRESVQEVTTTQVAFRGLDSGNRTLLLSSLSYLRYLFSLPSSYLQNIPLGQQFAQLLSLWTLGMNVILADEELNSHLQLVFESLICMATQKLSPETKVPIDCTDVPRITDLVQSVLAQFVAGDSYGSPVLGRWLWVLLQQGLSVDLRLTVWSSLSDIWHVLAVVPPTLPIRVYLQPYETHSEILQLYIRCLNSPQLSHPQRNLRQTALYRLFIHHLAHFIFHSTHAVWTRQQMFCSFLNAVSHDTDVLLDLLYCVPNETELTSERMASLNEERRNFLSAVSVSCASSLDECAMSQLRALLPSLS